MCHGAATSEKRPFPCPPCVFYVLRDSSSNQYQGLCGHTSRDHKAQNPPSPNPRASDCHHLLESHLKTRPSASRQDLEANRPWTEEQLVVPGPAQVPSPQPQEWPWDSCLSSKAAPGPQSGLAFWLSLDSIHVSSPSGTISTPTQTQKLFVFLGFFFS